MSSTATARSSRSSRLILAILARVPPSHGSSRSPCPPGRSCAGEPGFCTAALDELRTLYDIKSKLKATPWEERARERREHAASILHALLDTLQAARAKHLPGSPVALAIGYVPDREAVFTRSIDSGHLEIDTNACERSLRAVAVGRKNWQFAGSRFGGEAAAAWFT